MGCCLLWAKWDVRCLEHCSQLSALPAYADVFYNVHVLGGRILFLLCPCTENLDMENRLFGKSSVCFSENHFWVVPRTFLIVVPGSAQHKKGNARYALRHVFSILLVFWFLSLSSAGMESPTRQLRQTCLIFRSCHFRISEFLNTELPQQGQKRLKRNRLGTPNSCIMCKQPLFTIKHQTTSVPCSILHQQCSVALWDLTLNYVCTLFGRLSLPILGTDMHTTNIWHRLWMRNQTKNEGKPNNYARNFSHVCTHMDMCEQEPESISACMRACTRGYMHACACAQTTQLQC